ncbi:MAG TPA: hypothetical protein VLM89_00920 [Phycisphaerae bacterium]|nr:hypothetical protein [Phycisphaerae bacterium]
MVAQHGRKMKMGFTGRLPLGILQFASPDCYGCLVDNGCNAVTACGGTCEQALYQHFPQLNAE